MIELTWKEAETKFVDYCTKLGLPVEINYVNKQKNVPALPFWGGSPDKLTIHETANPSRGADARMHRDFVANGGGSELASYTASVDSNRLVLILHLDQANYHAGTNPGNMDSMSIETCINADGDWSKTKLNLAKASAAMLKTWELPVNATVEHNIWYGKDCPMTIRHEGSWNTIIALIGQYLRILTPFPIPAPPVTPPYVMTFDEVPYTIQHGFKDLWIASGGLRRCGFPISAEYGKTINGIDLTLQKFENVEFEYHPGIDPRFSGAIRRYADLVDKIKAGQPFNIGDYD